MSIEKLKEICQSNLFDQKLNTRLTEELWHIKAQDESNYFLDLYEKQTKFKTNENNLLVAKLLNLTDQLDETKEPAFDWGEFPDVDIDFIPQVRDYLKNEWAAKEFGKNKVCNISTYTTFNLKSTLLDVSRLFSIDLDEIQPITKQIGTKDEDGDALTLDTAIQLYPDLKNFLEIYPDVEKAVRKLLHRVRNMGVHASGLIISSVDLTENVPLITSSKSELPAIAWPEGLGATDCSAVGLVKFDFLSLDGNTKIVESCNLASKNFKILKDIEAKVSAYPGQGNWSNLDYLNDPQCLAAATRGDLRMVFQFDGSEGIRRLCRDGGVDSFDDLVAYTSLYRPASMAAGMHETYCKRKKGLEDWERHPILDPILDKTYGVLVFQEDVMKILNKVGNIPLKDCEAVRKAISKKKIEKFKKYKSMFLENGQVNLGWSLERVENLWQLIEFFSGYGFNLSHATAYCYISARMLYLKIHHPLAFYPSYLNHTNSSGPKDFEKIKSYIQDIKRHGVKINPLDINKSSADFNVKEDQIYYAFNKIKGIGEESAKKIESMQPYKDYDDFLDRFGYDAGVNQALLGLRAFGDDPQKDHLKYWRKKLHSKKVKTKIEQLEARTEKIKALFLVKGITLEEMNIPDYHEKGIADKLIKDWIKKKEELDLFKTNPEEEIKLSAAEKKTFEATEKILIDKDLSQEEYYGFKWDHPLEKCADFNGYTFERYEEEEMQVGPVEILIKAVEECKGPKTTYYKLWAEDSLSRQGRIMVWKDDYARFSSVLKKNNLIRIQVKAPSGGFTNYTIASLPRSGSYNKKQQSVIPVEQDYRVFLMGKK